MTGLLAECAQKGFHQVIAVIGDSANQASIRLHERLGFDRVGTLPGPSASSSTAGTTAS